MTRVVMVLALAADVDDAEIADFQGEQAEAIAELRAEAAEEMEKGIFIGADVVALVAGEIEPGLQLLAEVGVDVDQLAG